MDWLGRFQQLLDKCSRWRNVRQTRRNLGGGWRPWPGSSVILHLLRGLREFLLDSTR